MSVFVLEPRKDHPFPELQWLFQQHQVPRTRPYNIIDTFLLLRDSLSDSGWPNWKYIGGHGKLALLVGFLQSLCPWVSTSILFFSGASPHSTPNLLLYQNSRVYHQFNLSPPQEQDRGFLPLRRSWENEKGEDHNRTCQVAKVSMQWHACRSSCPQKEAIASSWKQVGRKFPM